MHRISQSLANAGYEVNVLGFGTTHKAELPDGEVRWRINRIWFKRGFLFYKELNLRLFFILLLSRSDILCACDMDTLLPNYLAARLRGKKLVFDAHEYFSETSGVIGRPMVQAVWKWLERFLIPRVDLGYSVSPGIAECLQKDFGKEFGVVRNVPKRISEGPIADWPKRGSFWIYQGALNKGRGLEALIEAMKVSSKKLLIAGKGPLESLLRKKVKDLGLEGKVEFMGQLKPGKLVGLTREAFGGFNLVEGEGLSYYYSLANKFFDYMAAGIPQVNTDLPEYRRICEDYPCSEFVNSNQSGEISRVIRELENDEAKVQEIKIQADLGAKVYTWQNEESRLIEMYEKL